MVGRDESPFGEKYEALRAELREFCAGAGRCAAPRRELPQRERRSLVRKRAASRAATSTARIPPAYGGAGASPT